jgi:hypothetical protein
MAVLRDMKLSKAVAIKDVAVNTQGIGNRE